MIYNHVPAEMEAYELTSVILIMVVTTVMCVGLLISNYLNKKKDKHQNNIEDKIDKDSEK